MPHAVSLQCLIGSAAALAVLTAGCASTKHPHGMDRAPASSVAQITASPQADDTRQLWADLWRTPLAAPVEDPKDAAYLGAPSWPARLLACQLPLNVATDRAWALTDENLLPPATRALWHANGLRLGVLSEAKWEAFRQALNGQEKNAPRHQGVMAQKLVTFTLRPFAEPLHKGHGLPTRTALALDTTLPPFAPAVRPLAVAFGDRMQLLVQGDFQDKTLAGLAFIPHLHHPDYFFGGIEPPKAWEKEAQGLQLTELTTPKWQPKPGQLLVIGLWWPWKVDPAKIEAEKIAAAKAEAQAAEAKTANSAAEQPPAKPLATTLAKPLEKPLDGAEKKQTTTPADDLVLSPTAPPLLPSLGRALFTAQNGEGDYQVLLVVGVK